MNLRGIYAITDERLHADSNTLLHQVELALRGGLALLQYRAKTLHPDYREQQAKALLSLCHEYHTPLLINDDLELALAIGADGVHLGREDGELRHAREQLGPRKILGASCYNRIELAAKAVHAGVDYVAFGRFFSSDTKPNAVQAEVDLIQQCRARFATPICCIGGITAANGEGLVKAGADLLAMVQGVFVSDEISANVQQMNQWF